MCIIDKKQEAVTQICMTIDNNRKACLDLDSMENVTENEVRLDLESESSKTWQLGSPEGKKMNLRVMGADLAKINSQYCSLDERVQDFIACNMPEEAIQLHFEDNIYISLEFPNIDSRLWLKRNANSHRCKGINEQYKCIVLKYQSVEDWTEGTNIM